MSHGVEFLLADLAGKFLLCIAVDNLDMLMQGPELLEGLITGDALKYTRKCQCKLLCVWQFDLQHSTKSEIVNIGGAPHLSALAGEMKDEAAKKLAYSTIRNFKNTQAKEKTDKSSRQSWTRHMQKRWHAQL